MNGLMDFLYLKSDIGMVFRRDPVIHLSTDPPSAGWQTPGA